MYLELQSQRSSAALPVDRQDATAQAAANSAAHPDAHVSQPQLAFNPQLASLTRSMFGAAANAAPNFAELDPCKLLQNAKGAAQTVVS